MKWSFVRIDCFTITGVDIFLPWLATKTILEQTRCLFLFYFQQSEFVKSSHCWAMYRLYFPFHRRWNYLCYAVSKRVTQYYRCHAMFIWPVCHGVAVDLYYHLFGEKSKDDFVFLGANLCCRSIRHLTLSFIFYTSCYFKKTGSEFVNQQPKIIAKIRKFNINCM